MSTIPADLAPRGDDVVDTVIVGAGQAGLATAYLLTRDGHDCVVLDGGRRVGDSWRHRYDSLTLFTPNRYNGLPGMPFPGAPWDFPGKDAVGDHLEAYATRFDLPVQLGTWVHRVRPALDGFEVETSRGRTTCRNVVVATGLGSGLGSGTPQVPSFAAELDPAITQLHARDYRRPGQIPDGPVLVVGAAHSGCDIARELAATHRTTLAGRDPGQIPLSWDSRAVRVVLPVAFFLQKHVKTRRTPIGRRDRTYVLNHGGPMLRVKRADLERAGVARTHARVVGVRDGLPLLDDGSIVEATTVVWATGYRHDYSWLDLPVLDASGWPRELRGVATDVDGLFFCGLTYQYAFASMDLLGVGRDAAYVARRIRARQRSRRALPAGTARAS